MEGISIKESEGQIDVTIWANKPVVLSVFPTRTAQTVTGGEKKAEGIGKTETKTVKDEFVGWLAKPIKKGRKPRRKLRTMKHKRSRRYLGQALKGEDVAYAAKSMGVFSIPHMMLTHKGNNTARAYHRMTCQVQQLIRRGLVKRTGRKVKPDNASRLCTEYAWVGDTEVKL